MVPKKRKNTDPEKHSKGVSGNEIPSQSNKPKNNEDKKDTGNKRVLRSKYFSDISTTSAATSSSKASASSVENKSKSLKEDLVSSSPQETGRKNNRSCLKSDNSSNGKNGNLKNDDTIIVPCSSKMNSNKKENSRNDENIPSTSKDIKGKDISSNKVNKPSTSIKLGSGIKNPVLESSSKESGRCKRSCVNIKNKVNPEWDMNSPCTSKATRGNSLNTNTESKLKYSKPANKNKRSSNNKDILPNTSTAQKENVEKSDNNSIIKEGDFSTHPNFLKVYFDRQYGYCTQKVLQKVQNKLVSKSLLNLNMISRNSFFGERIRSMEWNPYQENQFIIASKHGNVVVGEIREHLHVILQTPGMGPGGAWLGMKFSSISDLKYRIWSCGHEGKLFRTDYSPSSFSSHGTDWNSHISSYLSTENYEHWYTSLDITSDQKKIGIGDTKGIIQFVNQDGKLLNKFRVGKQKVPGLEFCSRNENMFITTSLDRTVKVWDQRYMKDMNSFVVSLPHNFGVNSAYFNKNCDMLLTTDQRDEIRLYETSTWRLLNTIKHPHRQFQHLSPIKATWHPTADIIVIGRFPLCKSEIRTVDLMLPTGELVGQFDSSSSLVITIAKFSADAKYLATAASSHIEIWSTPQNVF